MRTTTCRDSHSIGVARRDTIPAQRRKTSATCREPCPPNRLPHPDTTTATSIARCGTMLAQRHISIKTRRLARTPREDAHKDSCPPHNLTPMLLPPRDSTYTSTCGRCTRTRIPLRRCRSMRDKTGAGGALHCPNVYITDVPCDDSVTPEERQR